QFEVLADRIRTEYDIPVHFEATELYTARWVDADDDKILKKFIDENRISMGEDHDGAPVFMARNAWHLSKAQEDFPDIKMLKTREQSIT
ncbi:MAG: peptide chain release factor 3, partial [Rhodospirillaceae bacterium]|nr:peptide chain release factor 3 [Rhodospirillaceae bacterium]